MPESLDMPHRQDEAPVPTDPAMVRLLMPIVFVGFLIVGLALLVMQWPVPPGVESVTVPLLVRIVQPNPGESSLGFARRFLDLAVYGLFLIGIGMMLTAWKSGGRRLLLGLMAVAVLGLAYASGMALYNGPMVSICGFTLILFGGMVAWVASSLGEAEEPETETLINTGQDGQESQAPQEAVEIRTNDHASTHSVA